MIPTMGADPAAAKKKDKAVAKSIAEKIGQEYQAKSSGVASNKDPLVYLGQQAVAPSSMPGPYSASQQGSLYFQGGTGHKTANYSQVAQQYYEWDEKTKNKFITQLSLAGYDPQGMPDAKVASLWSDYAKQAAQYYNNGAGAPLTPWDILAKDRKQRESYAATPRTISQTSTSYDISTKEDAHAIFLTASQQLLGRDPTKAETKNFQSALNAMEKSNPTITTQTSKYVGQELQSQTSTTKGGVKEGARQVLATEDIKKDPEYGAYQAATTYFDALMQTIGGA